eukprot:789269-Rhodomonas_salina.3
MGAPRWNWICQPGSEEFLPFTVVLPQARPYRSFGPDLSLRLPAPLPLACLHLPLLRTYCGFIPCRMIDQQLREPVADQISIGGFMLHCCNTSLVLPLATFPTDRPAHSQLPATRKLPANILGQLWPSTRVVLGLRVCKALRGTVCSPCLCAHWQRPGLRQRTAYQRS